MNTLTERCRVVVELAERAQRMLVLCELYEAAPARLRGRLGLASRRRRLRQYLHLNRNVQSNGQSKQAVERKGKGMPKVGLLACGGAPAGATVEGQTN